MESLQSLQLPSSPHSSSTPAVLVTDEPIKNPNTKKFLLLANIAHKITPKSVAKLLSQDNDVAPLNLERILNEVDSNTITKGLNPSQEGKLMIQTMPTLPTLIAAMIGSPRKKRIIKLQLELAERNQEYDQQICDFAVKEMSLLSKMEASLQLQIKLNETNGEALLSKGAMQSQLTSLNILVRDLQKDKDYLESENSNISSRLDSLENEEELNQKKMVKKEKECKVLLGEKDNLSIQLKGAQRELQELNSFVTASKQKELWAQMEGDLQAKEEGKKSDELKLLQDEYDQLKKELLLKKNTVVTMQSQLTSLNISVRDLQKDKDYLESENSNISSRLDTVENEDEKNQKKMFKKEKENKILLGEKDNLTIQLKGAQREMQELNVFVTASKQKELWAQMEGDLQAKEEGKKAEALKSVQDEYEQMKQGSQVTLKAKAAEIVSMQSQLTSLTISVRDLQKDKDYLESENSNISSRLDSVENEDEKNQKKMVKKEKENKILLGEKDNLTIQLRGAQRELQELNVYVTASKQKELWAQMEGDLQAKEAGKKVEEQEKYELVKNELQACQITLKEKDLELKKKTLGMTTLRNEFNSFMQIVKDLEREKGYLTSEQSNTVNSLDVAETALEKTQQSLLKIEKDGKNLRAERDNLSLQLRGCQRELQQVNQVVGDFKQKELWMSMEEDLLKQKKNGSD